MRIGNLDGRLTLFRDGGAVDVAEASGELFSADPQAVYRRWDEFRRWAAQNPGTPQPYSLDQLGPPAPRPEQVFGIGANYRAHAAEGGLEVPEWPMVFTKYVSSFASATGVITLPTDTVDWEVELVVVVGRTAFHVPAEHGWSYVAGLTLGQDLSERTTQLLGQLPQMSMGKSFPGFSPTGPYLVTPEEFDDPDNLQLSCLLNGDVVQKASTADLVHSVPKLIAELSSVLPLSPGDVIFTGTPEGVGTTRKPPRYVQPGDVLVSRLDG
ncbi:fumarylacetoacetate hydrolase family protein, partial [Mycobacterium sp.]|uniref:fumarylacetoacetate hydrolase family protein n=1 Tax=Mycobacterium sp. TaxID=1785 RepID=UPI002C63B388